MTLAPESEVGNCECVLRRIQVHHPHNPPNEVADSVQHNTSKQRDACCVANYKEGSVSQEVQDIRRGQEDHSDCSLEQFEPGQGSEKFNVWQSINQRVLLCGQVRVFGQRCDFRDEGFVGAQLERCVRTSL